MLHRRGDASGQYQVCIWMHYLKRPDHIASNIQRVETPEEAPYHEARCVFWDKYFHVCNLESDGIGKNNARKSVLWEGSHST